jgi:PAS domain S-box-containing protein
VPHDPPEGATEQARRAAGDADAFLDSILEHIPNMVFVKDAQQLRFVRFNRAGETLLGYSREALLGKSDHDFFPASEADAFTRRDREVLASGVVLDIPAEPIHTRAGLRYLHTKKVPIYDAQGTPRYLLGISEDITERKAAEDALQRAHEMLEEKVRERTAELQRVNAELQAQVEERKLVESALARHAQGLARSNKELEQYAYVASHDLQEPLRMVTSYVQLLAERYRGRLDEAADEFIDFALDGTVRMKQLIDDLLSYSRVGTRNREMVPADTGEIMLASLENLRLFITETDAVIDYGELPKVLGDETQLQQLFQNLLGNALKFRGAEAPRISVQATARDGSWEFAVADNGIGIDAAHHDEVFKIFRRLHGRGEYEGTGIGLALCKKIVERHGGQIRLQSQPGAGTTVYFTLPAA